MTEVDYGALDKLIIKHIGILTPREIAAKVGCEPSEVLRRKDELFSEIDVLTNEQKKAKLIIDLQMAAQDALDRAKNMPDEYFAGAQNSAINAQKEILKQLENYDKYDEERIEQLNRLRVREIIQLVSGVVDALMPVMEAKYGVARDEIEGEVLTLLEIEATRMENNAL